MQCKKHPGYLGIMTPRADCRLCWLIYAKSLQTRVNYAHIRIQEIEDDENDNSRK